MIKNPWDVSNMGGWDALNHAHGQIPVLGTLVAYAKTADLTDLGGAVNTEMADKVLTKKQVGIPIRLEVGIVAAAFLAKFVLIAVDQVGIGKAIEFKGDAGQRMGTEFVVVIQKGDKLALRQCKRGIGSGGNVSVGL